MSEINIKYANVDNIKEIIKLDKQCFGNEKYDKKLWNFLLEVAIVKIAVDTQKQNKIVGIIVNIDTDQIKITKTIQLLLNKLNIASCNLIFSICVAEQYRGQNIGSQLIDNLIKSIKGYVVLNVRESNVKAQNFYIKHGFITFDEIEKDYYSAPEENAIVMYAKLT